MPESGRLPNAETAAASPILIAAEKLVVRIEALVQQVAELKADNAQLRRDVKDAVALIERGAGAAAPAKTPAKRAGAPKRSTRRRRARGAKGRATPASVTQDTVLAAIGKLGPATASEIAKELSALGAPVSGRAVRFLAERVGATTSTGDDGQRRYRLPSSAPRPV